MKIQRSYLQISASLIIGLIIGSFGFGSASAEESPAPIQQGQVLNVCVDKKTYAMRAVKRCKATERAVVLGGPGPQGIQGETGAQGETGETGYTGATGAAGSIGSLKTKYIRVLHRSYPSFCGSDYESDFSVLSNKTSLSQYGSTISLNKSCINLTESTMTVYVP